MSKTDVMRHILWIKRSCEAGTIVTAMQRNAFLLITPFVTAGAVTTFWYFVIWKFGWYCSPDAAQQHGTMVAVIFLIYAIPAGLVFVSNWDRYKVISNAAWEKDKISFMKIRDRKMPAKMHIMFGSIGLAGLIVIMFGGYPSVGSGIMAVFSSWFVMTAYFIATKQLEDPSTSTWFKVEVPRDWQEDNPFEYLVKVGVIHCERNSAPEVTAG